MFGTEPHAPYDRPPLSKHVLRDPDMSLPRLLPPTVEPNPNIEWRHGVTALRLDADQHQLITDAGPVDYSSLVIATGSHARRIPDLPGHVLRTWDDALKLRADLRPGAVLAIVGAGLIGCEVAASARELGAEVHLIDILDAPMIRVVGPTMAAIVTELHLQHGVNLHLPTSVQAGAGGTLILADGTVLTPDVVLQAIGAAPNTSWLEGSGLDISNGVLCDDTGRTELPDVYAVGDVAGWAGHRSEHWSSAGEQANAVASAITGQQAPPDALPYWWSDQYDVKFQGLGTVAEADDVRIGAWGPAGRTVALYGTAGQLVGVVGLSSPKAVLGLRPDILAGVPLEEVVERYDNLAASG